MDPFFQAVLIAQQQRDLQAIAAEDRRAAQLPSPGRYGTWTLGWRLRAARTPAQMTVSDSTLAGSAVDDSRRMKVPVTYLLCLRARTSADTHRPACRQHFLNLHAGGR